MAGCRLGKTVAGNDPEVSCVVLKEDEHEGGEGHHPEEPIAVNGAGSHVGRPVTGIDEADRDEDARPDVLHHIRHEGQGSVAVPRPVGALRHGTTRPTGRSGPRCGTYPRRAD